MVGVIFTTSSIKRLLLQSTIVIRTKIPNTPKKCRVEMGWDNKYTRTIRQKSLSTVMALFSIFSLDFTHSADHEAS